MLGEIYIFYLKMYFIHLDKKKFLSISPIKSTTFLFVLLWKIFFPEYFCQKKYRNHFNLLEKWQKIFLNILRYFFVEIYLDNFLHNKLKVLCLPLCRKYLLKGFNLIHIFSDSVSPGELTVRIYMRYLYTWKKKGNSWKITWKPDRMDTASGFYSWIVHAITEKKVTVFYLGHIQWEKCISLIFSS